MKLHMAACQPGPGIAEVARMERLRQVPIRPRQLRRCRVADRQAAGGVCFWALCFTFFSLLRN